MSVGGQYFASGARVGRSWSIRFFSGTSLAFTLKREQPSDERLQQPNRMSDQKGDRMSHVLKLQMLNSQTSMILSGDALVSSFSGLCPLNLENVQQYQFTQHQFTQQ